MASAGEYNQQYTDGPESFEPEPLPEKIDASEFRDFGQAPLGYADQDVATMERSAPDTSAVSAGTTDVITRDRGRRLRMSDGNDWTEIDETQAVAARVFSTSVAWVHPSNDYAAPVPVMLLAEDQQRMRTLISVPTIEGETSGVIIGSLTDIQSGIGFFLAPGTTTEIKIQGSVWVTYPNWAANPQTPLPVTLWIERGL